MRRLLTTFGLALLAAGVLAPQASAALTARDIRIGDHPGFVRVVVDFTGGRVEPGEVVATDPNPFPDGFVRLPLTRSGVRTTADPVRDHGVFARIAQTSGRRITIRVTGTDRRFKYVGYVAQHTPERLVIDMFKARPPSDAAEITRGRGGCLRLTDHDVTRDRVTAEGRERDLFEHSLVVRLRRDSGRIHRQKPETAFMRAWSTEFTYSPVRRQTGTLEAVALSAKDGTLDCLVQVRVRMGGELGLELQLRWVGERGIGPAPCRVLEFVPSTGTKSTLDDRVVGLSAYDRQSDTRPIPSLLTQPGFADRRRTSLRRVLFPALADPPDKLALRFPSRELTYRQLRDAAAAVAEQVHGRQRVAAWAVNEPEIAVGVIGALLAGVPVTPINPKAGTSELGHILSDSDPELVLCPPGTDVPDAIEERGRVDVDLDARGGDLPDEPG